MQNGADPAGSAPFCISARFARAQRRCYARPPLPQPPRARSCTLASLCVATLVLVWSSTQGAQAQADLGGTYRAGPQQTSVVITTWGEDCGPRPQNATDDPKASVTVKVVGQQLSLVFPDRTLRSNGCWSPNPAVRVASATATETRWRTECQTPSSDAKRERGVYTLTLSEAGVLDLLEESNYDWQLNNSRCVAKVRVTQRVARNAAALTSSPPPAAAAPAATGCTPGPLARLRVRPSELRIGPGERTCLSVRGLDAAGCALPSLDGVKWELSAPAGARASLSGACFKAAPSAAEAEGTFRIVASRGSLRDEASITVATTDLSDITARRGGVEDAALDAEDADDRAASFGIEAAVKRSSPLVKGVLVALLLASIGALTWFVRLSSRKHTAALGTGERARDSATAMADRRDSGERPAARGSEPASAATPSSPVSGAGEQLICPVCRHGYAGGTTRCPRDGATPIPYAEFVQRAQAAQAGPRTCTSCGAQLAAGAAFCGACGARVHS
jgi:hypothetical protein